MLASAYHAYSGLWWVAPRTPSLKVAMAALVVLLGVGIAMGFGPVEIALLILSGTVILATETVNTAIELLCDRLHPDPDEVIGRVKDVAAGATALCELGATSVFVVMLVPHVLERLGR